VAGQRLLQVVAHVPAKGQAVGHHSYELPLAPEVLEEHDQLQLEEDDRVDGGPAAPRVERPHQIHHER
jgi:hypothetical protein